MTIDATAAIAAVRAVVCASVGMPARIEPLEGGAGTGARGFVVHLGSRRLHAKCLLPLPGRTLTLEQEFELQLRLSHRAICPRPVVIDSDTGVIVSEFAEGYRPLQAEESRMPAAIAAIGRTLRLLHDTEADVPSVPFAATLERYLSLLGGAPLLSAAERELADEALALAVDFDRRPVAGVCHGDLVADNILVGDSGFEKLLLVDFEYAARAPIELDLASLSVMNDFDRAQDDRLLDAYFGSSRMRIRHAEFAKVRRLVALTAHLWARSRLTHERSDPAASAAAADVERYLLVPSKRP